MSTVFFRMFCHLSSRQPMLISDWPHAHSSGWRDGHLSSSGSRLHVSYSSSRKPRPQSSAAIAFLLHECDNGRLKGGPVPYSRFLVVLPLTGWLVGIAAPPASAQRNPANSPQVATPANVGRPATPVPPEKSSVTSHEMKAGGKTIRYTATAGSLLIQNDEEQPDASVFYVAYTLDGVADLRSRPLTFLYNGGPGSASMWLHMGSVGPVRVLTSSPDASGPGPYQIAPNEYTLLNQSDLVFVDAVGTGYSRPV